MKSEDKLYKKLKTVGFATKYNFQPFTYKSGKNVKNSLQQPTNNINSLKQGGMIKQVEIYPPPASPYQTKLYSNRKYTFYAPSGYKGKIARRELEHSFGIADIALAFAYRYEDYKITIKHEPRFGTYNPDIYVSLNDYTRQYDFLVEFERTRTPGEVLKDKVYKNNNFDFEKYGLHRSTKVLIIYTFETWDVFWRPMEYDQEFMERVEKSVFNMSKQINNPRYIFMAYHNFPYLDQEVWYQGGKRYKLIN